MGEVFIGLPLTSWIIESTADDQDFIRITTIARNLGTLLGILIGAVLAELQLIPPAAYAVFNLIGNLITLFLLVRYVPNPVYMEVPKQPEVIPSLRTCLRTQEFKVTHSYLVWILPC